VSAWQQLAMEILMRGSDPQIPPPPMYRAQCQLLHTSILKVKLQSGYIIQIVTGIEVNSESNFPKLQEYCPSAEGTWAIFPQLKLDHVIEVLTGKPVNRSIPHISLHHVTRFEPITAAHFDQRYNNIL